MIKFLIPVAISLATLCITWLNYYRSRLDRGTVGMTQPPYIALTPGAGTMQNATIVFAALIHGTSDRGVYIENLYIRLEREDGIQNFNECSYEDHGVLRPGAFLADKQGLATNFHFWSPGHGISYQFLPGDYRLRIFAKIAGESELLIGDARLSLTNDLYQAMRKQNKGIYFVWSPESQCYIGHLLPETPKLNLYKLNERIL